MASAAPTTGATATARSEDELRKKVKRCTSILHATNCVSASVPVTHGFQHSLVCLQFDKLVRVVLILPGATARAGSSFTGSFLHKTNLPPVDVCSVQLVQRPLHVRLRAELDHSFIGALFVGVCVGHFPRLTHEVLEGRDIFSKGKTYIYTHTHTHTHQESDVNHT